jgi:DNA modification methylase
MLQLQLQALLEAGLDLEITGFDEREPARLVVQVNQQALTSVEDAPPLQDEAVTKPGDLWILGDHRLLCGDSTQPDQLQRVLDGRSSDMIFTDPPYNAAYVGKTAEKLTITNDDLGDDFEAFLCRSCQTMLAVNSGAVYICMSSGQLHKLYKAFCHAGGHWSTWIIWAKHTFTLGHSDYQRQFEPILYGWKDGTRHYWCGDRNQGDVWLIDKPHANKEHPTMKPLELVERAIVNSSRKKDVVLDPFGGSGTTLLAAERTGRRARVLEIDARYVDVVVRRWQSYTNESAVLETGESFTEIAEQRWPEKAEAI